MSGAGSSADRRPTRALRASLLVNAALVVKIVIFDPNLAIRPVCLDRDAPLPTNGYVALGGAQTERYRELLRSSMRRNFRVDGEGYVYRSAWDTWRIGLERRWHMTGYIIGDGNCEVVRAQAIEPNP